MKNEDVCAPRRVSSFNFMNMSIHVEYLSELSEILPHKISRGQEAADMTVRCVNKNEKEFKGGIIACTQRAGILVKFSVCVCSLSLKFSSLIDADFC